MFPLDELKNFITGFAFRWILKVGGTYLATIGIQSSTVEEIVGGIVAILFGVIVSLFQTKKALNTPVK